MIDDFRDVFMIVVIVLLSFWIGVFAYNWFKLLLEAMVLIVS